MNPAAMFLTVAVLLLPLSTHSQIPAACVDRDSVSTKTCCLVPQITGVSDPGPCGKNRGRGECRLIDEEEDLSDSTTDVRNNWPHFFTRVCNCSSHYGGYDCGECEFGYCGDDCSERYSRERRSATALDDAEWRVYIQQLRMAKTQPSRYVVILSETEPASELQYVTPSVYDFFVWIHHYVAKNGHNNEGVDYNHQSSGFPTWHRLFLLAFEREMQHMLNNSEFTLHYWDWRNPDDREALFQIDRLGARSKDSSLVWGEIFGVDWQTICWGVDRTKPCDPTVTTGRIRRCPIGDACKKENTNWPTYDDTIVAISKVVYDAAPYDKTARNGFRNSMEGFSPGELGTVECKRDQMCAESDGLTIKRHLHNTVHIMLGSGYFDSPVEDKEKGVMGDLAAAVNDPIFLNHHTMVDCILEEWLQRNPNKNYPLTEEEDKNGTHKGQRRDDYLVPFLPLYRNIDMFKTADNFGYTCTLPNITVHIMLGSGYFDSPVEDKEKGVMGDLAAAVNDPIFLNHHTMVDCILEEWLQRNPNKNYPLTEEEDKNGTHKGQRRDDYLVPFLPLYRNIDMFKTADNFGYTCTLPNITVSSIDGGATSGGVVSVVVAIVLHFKSLLVFV